MISFFWALLQPLRAVWWQLKYAELRALALKCALVTVAAVTALLGAAFFAAGPLQRLVFGSTGVVAAAEQVVIYLLLSLVALFAALQLQGPITSAFCERMSLFVQKQLTGVAPEPELGKRRVLLGAVKSLFPTLRALLLWGLTAAAAALLVLLPPFGPLLVVPVQLMLGAAFLAHAAVAQVRPRLGLPRRLYLKQPGAMLGLAIGFVPFVMFPPFALAGAGAIAISGTFVGLRIGDARAAPAPGD
jgi:hypothetical protein